MVPPPPSDNYGADNAPPAPPPPPSEDGQPGMVPPPPSLPSYTAHDMVMPTDMYSRPAPNPVLPVPRQYQANADNRNTRPKQYKMAAAGASWEDQTLHDWPEDDHRIFVGDLGNECNDDLLAQ